MPDKNDPDVQIAKRLATLIAAIPVMIIILIILFSTLYTIHAGQRGVLLTFGKPDPVAKGEGLHIKWPWPIQSIVKLDVKTQKYAVDKATAASKDLQTVTTDVTLNYNLNPADVPHLYQTIGEDYQNTVIAPAIQEVIKSATAQYTAEELITKRPEVKDKIDLALKERLSSFNIFVQTVSITNFDFSKSFNDAIELKVTAEQNALAAKNKLAQVEYEAQQRITQAEGEAKAIQIQADAIRSQGGAAYVQLQAIKQWDGKLPTFMGGNGVIPFLNKNLGTSSFIGSSSIPAYNNTG